MAEHNTLTGSALHEPKGIAAVVANRVYVSDGGGSGDWTPLSSINEYASISGHDLAATISNIGTTRQQVLIFDTVGPENGAVGEVVTDSLTLTNAGDYAVNFSISFATAAVGDAGVYEFHLNLNGSETQFACIRQMSGSSDNGSAGFTGIVSVTAGQTLTVWVESDDGGDGDDIIIDMISLNAMKTGG